MNSKDRWIKQTAKLYVKHHGLTRRNAICCAKLLYELVSNMTPHEAIAWEATTEIPVGVIEDDLGI